MKLFRFLLFVCLLILIGCRFPTFEKPVAVQSEDLLPKDCIVFYAIDNEVLVSLNDRELFMNKRILTQDDDRVVIDLKSQLQTGRNTIKIQLRDTPSECLHNRWEIIYDIYQDAEIVDYWRENGDEDATCEEAVKVEKTHYIDI